MPLDHPDTPCGLRMSRDEICSENNYLCELCEYVESVKVFEAGVADLLKRVALNCHPWKGTPVAGAKVMDEVRAIIKDK